MSTSRRFVRNHSMIVFGALACLFGWGIYLFAAVGIGSNPDNMPLGPLLAALVVASCQGREDLRRWGRALRTWRISPRWYVLAVLAPIAIHLVIVAANSGLGAPWPTSHQLGGWTDLPGTFVFMLVLVGIGEEAGWTAFAAPLLLRKHSVLVSWAILAPIRILWHLPLMLSGEMPWLMGIVGNAGFQLLLLVLFRASDGGWQLAAVWHATLNTFGGGFFFGMVTGADNARLCTLLAAAYAGLALAVVLRRRHSVLASPAMAPEPMGRRPVRV
jgi:hypothetical protein